MARTSRRRFLESLSSLPVLCSPSLPSSLATEWKRHLPRESSVAAALLSGQNLPSTVRPLLTTRTIETGERA
jgi:hypothetical protein